MLTELKVSFQRREISDKTDLAFGVLFDARYSYRIQIYMIDEKYDCNYQILAEKMEQMYVFY